MKVQIIFREIAGKDIINWYNSLPEGEHSNQIRIIFKKYMLEEKKI
ncbi:MAG: hypothetical protein PWQ94_1243 [Thermoanaerobacterium sp.]|nr:hypothetical protein [Thermoanaerobacterium sp.]